jgi:hypothetical protein
VQGPHRRLVVRRIFGSPLRIAQPAIEPRIGFPPIEEIEGVRQRRAEEFYFVGGAHQLVAGQRLVVNLAGSLNVSGRIGQPAVGAGILDQ